MGYCFFLLLGCLDGTLTVKYSTKDGSANAGSDYVAVTGELTFGPGESAPQQLKVTIIDDDEIEDDEEFFVVLSEPSDPKAASTRKGRAVEMIPFWPKSDADDRPPLVCGCLPQLTPQPLPLHVPSVDHPWCVCIVPWIT